MRRIAVALLIVALCPLTAQAVGRDEILLQMQAADALGGAIQSALEQAPMTRPASTSQPAETVPSYRELFDRTVDAIKKDGTPDASLNNLTTAQLFGEMTALQTYNLQQYARLTRRRDGGPTTLPSVQTLVKQPTTVKSPLWQKKRQQVHNAVTARLDAARQQSAEQSSAAPAGSTPPTYSRSWDDPRWQPYFYGPTDSLTGWNENFSDTFTFQNGGGLYQRFDTRVNRDHDPRVGGDFDRRVNIDYDRRTNIHVDPRLNY
jgi:hypothetical protein